MTAVWVCSGIALLISALQIACHNQGHTQELEKGGAKRIFFPPYWAVENRITNSEKKCLFVKKKRLEWIGYESKHDLSSLENW